MISQDHVIKGTCDFMGKTPLVVTQISAKFDGNRYRDSRNTMILVSHVISQDNMIKGSSNGQDPLKVTYHLPSLVALGTVVAET